MKNLIKKLLLMVLLAIVTHSNAMSVDYIVGTGNAASTTSYNAPFYNSYGCGHGEYLFTQADITAAGMTPGLITKLAIMPLTTTTAAGAANNWGTVRIKLATTNLTAFPAGKSSFTTAVWSEVYSQTNYTFGNQIANTWVDFVFDTPFVYTGGALLVRICYENSKTSNSTIGNFRGSATAAGEKTFFTYQDNNPSICSGIGTNKNTSLTYRPDMRFGVQSAGVAMAVAQKPDVKLYANDIFYEHQRPSTQIARFTNPAGPTAQFKYTIIGPLGATDTVYRANNGAWIDVNTTIGLTNYTFTSANGRMANTDGTLNLVQARPGTYTVITVIDDKQATPPVLMSETTTFQIDSVASSYTVTASSASAGSISPSGVVPGFPGAPLTFNFAATAAGYAIDEVLIDGVNNAAAVQTGEYTFPGNTTGSHTIHVTYAPAYIVGTGNAASTTSYNAPFYSSWGCGNGEYLLTESDLTAAGVLPGMIKKLALMPLTTTTAGGATNNWGTVRIKLATTNLTAFPAGKSSFTTAVWSEVYSKTNYTFGSQLANTWVDYVFDTPYLYVGGGLLVQICYENSKSSNSTIGNFRGSATAAGEKTFFTYQDNNPSICSGIGTYKTSSLTYRPDMRLGMEHEGVVMIIDRKPNTKLYSNDIFYEHQRPSTQIARFTNPAGPTAQFKYTIIGPLGATDTVYRANNGAWIDINPAIGLTEYTFASANGRMANTNGTLNLEQARPGTYKIIIDVDDKQSSIIKDTTAFQIDSVVKYTVVASSGAHGSISPSGTLPLFAGTSKKFVFTPDAGYVIDSVLIDGIHNHMAMGAGEYTFMNAAANHTIRVIFAKAVNVIAGVGNTTTVTSNAPFYTSWGCGNGEYLFTKSDLTDMSPGSIRKLALQLKTYNSGGAGHNWGTVRIKLANAPASTTTFPSGKSSFTTTTWTEVYTKPSFSFGTRVVDEWIEFVLDAPFTYTDGALLVQICYEGTNTSNTSIGTFRASTTPVSGDKTYFIRADNNTSFCSLTSGTEVGKIAYRPDIRFSYLPIPQKITSIVSSLEKRLTTPRPGVAVIKTQVNADSDSTNKSGINTITQLTFDAKNTNSNYISNVKCYYSSENDFNTAKPYGVPTSISSNMTFTQNVDLKSKHIYFWVTYDVVGTTPDGTKIGAKLTSVTKEFDGNVVTYPDPYIELTNADPGYVTVKLPLSKGAYTIGTGGDYATLAEFAEAYSAIGINANTTATIISDISETEQVLFDKGPLGNYNLTIRPAVDLTPKVRNEIEGTAPMVIFNKSENISLEGSNSLTIKRKNLTFNSRVTAVEIIDAKNIEISDIVFMGVNLSDSTRINIKNSEYVTIDRNHINNVSTGIYANGVKNLAIRYNTIENAAVGLLLEGANLSATISSNQLLNLYNSTANTFGFVLRGVGLANPLGMKIHNNTINGISGGASVVGILFNNISGVDVAHNTIYMFRRPGQVENVNSSVIVEEVAGNSKINLRNNIFYNDLKGGVNGIFASPSTTSNPFDLLDYNVYYASTAFWGTMTGGSLQNYNAWRNFVASAGSGKNDAHSHWYLDGDFKLVSESDSHIDGTPCVIPEFNTPVIAEVLQDMDGELRGAVGTSLTTIGADHVAINFIEEDVNYPSDEYNETVTELNLCEGTSDLLLFMRKTFKSWADGVNRTYLPVVRNIWVRSPFDKPTQLDTLNLDDKFYVNGAGIYHKNLTYEYSGNYRVYSTLGTQSFVSNWVPIKITKIASMAIQPESKVLVCSDAGSVMIKTKVDGTISSMQWERKINGVWVQVANATSENLTLEIANEADLISKSGEYRLRLNTPGTCDLPRIVYSNICTIDAGHPIEDVVAEANYDTEKLMSLCENDELILTASVKGTALAYQWQKYDELLDEFVDISAEVEPTAGESKYRIVSISIDNTGLYRCFVTGPEYCQTGKEGISNTIQVRIKETARILQQPSEIITCVGNKKSVLEPVVTGDVHYQWYKDGKLIKDATSPKLDFYNRIDSVSRDTVILGRDTTVVLYDTLGIRYEDIGVYELEVYYNNCAGEPDVMRSNPVPVYVYGPTNIASQTNFIYAMKDGYGILEVEASTIGSELQRETYQWYRKRSATNTEKLTNSNKVKGAKSSQLVISALTQSDINNPNSADDYYYCVVSGVCNEAVTQPIRIKLVPEIVINKDLMPLEICAKEDAEFEVEAYGTEPNQPIAYKWYKDGKLLVDGGNISGATTRKLVISSATSVDIGSYYADIRYVNLNAAITTSEANLLVEAAPIITKQPAPVKIDILNTQDFMLTVEVEEQYDGYVCSYQWYKNNTEILNAIDPYYVVTGAELSDAGEYYVVVTSLRGCGETSSTKIPVTIEDSNIDENQISEDFSIISILPNPVSSKAILNYNMPNSGEVSIRVVDVTGRTMMNLFAGVAVSGLNELPVDMSSLHSGTYYVILESNGMKTTYPVVIVK